MLSRQNCILNAPTVGLETRSGIRASSMLSARIARKASRVEDGMNVCNVNEGESNFLQHFSMASFTTDSTDCNRFEQYARAPAMSPSEIVEGCGAGVVYGVVA